MYVFYNIQGIVLLIKLMKILYIVGVSGDALRSCEGHFPSSRSSPPATQFAAGCGNVYVYRRGDGFYGIECGSLCRFLFALDEMRPAWQACFCCFLGPVLFVINFNQIK